MEVNERTKKLNRIIDILTERGILQSEGMRRHYLSRLLQDSDEALDKQLANLKKGEGK